jgi:hypothetical protein
MQGFRVGPLLSLNWGLDILNKPIYMSKNWVEAKGDYSGKFRFVMNSNLDMEIRPAIRQLRRLVLFALGAALCALLLASSAVAASLEEATGATEAASPTGAAGAAVPATTAATTTASTPSPPPPVDPTTAVSTTPPAAVPAPETPVPLPAASPPAPAPTEVSALPAPARVTKAASAAITRTTAVAAADLPSIPSVGTSPETKVSAAPVIHTVEETAKRVASPVIGSSGGLPIAADLEATKAEADETLGGVLAAATGTVRGVDAAALEADALPSLLPRPPLTEALGPSPSAPTPVGLGASDFNAALEVSPMHRWFPGAPVRRAVTDPGGRAGVPAGRGAYASGFARFLSASGTAVQSSATAAASSSFPADPSLPPSPLPGPAPVGTTVDGGGISLFFPLVALLALFALAVPTALRRLGEVGDPSPPVPFLCALERPG